MTEKQAVVAALTEKLQKCASGVLVDYKGITVAEDTALRALLRNENVEYSVVKNTMVRFALDDVGMQELDPVLNGTTAMAISHEDPIAPMRVINKFAKQFNGTKFVIKAGFMDGKVLPLADVIALADLPSKDVLVAQVLGTMLAPITALAIVLKAIAEKNGSAAPVAEVAAPAAEVAAPAEEVAAPVEEVAAPVAEVAAPAEETPAE
ncbi:MAG: 50S ribosomal protein L10 [Oscillospiraceae bacterium]